MNYDKNIDAYEIANKITLYRQGLLQHATGFVLETGVGTSRNLKFYPYGVKLLGVDWSSNFLEVAFHQSVSTIQYDYQIEDVEMMTFQDDVFDTVVDTFGLEYYSKPDKALQEMKRVCQKDGLILIMTGGYSKYDLLNYFIEYQTPYTVSTKGFFPNRQWEEIIDQDNEFEIISQDRKMNGTIYLYILRNKKP